MSPIIQSLANASAYGYRSFAAADTTSFESIATTTVGSGGTSTITFSSIPSTYTHLQLRIMARTTVTNDSDFCGMRFNSDSGSNYYRHTLNGNGSSASASSDPAAYCIVQRIPTNQFSSNIFGAIILDILDYKDTNKYKVTRHLGGFDSNGGGQIVFESNLWKNTNAINTITIIPSNGSSFSFLEYSHFALYGIKSA